MSSLKIYRALHPCLFETAQERGIGVNPLANGLIYRSLLCESLGPKAIRAFPGRDAMDLKTAALGRQDGVGGVDRRETTLSFWSKRFARSAEPFQDIAELSRWYESSVVGVARGLALAERASRARCWRRPGELNVQWRYETSVLYLNQIYTESIKYLVASSSRFDSHD